MVNRLAIVTGEDAPDLTDDGQRLREEFRARGFDAEPAVWTDRRIDWSRFDAALVRSCWKYYTAPDRFRNWLETVEDAGTTVLNRPHVVRWNLHKSYLLDLEAEGVPIVPTTFVERGSDRTLEAILRERGWDEAVVKPPIGTSSAGIWKTTMDTASDDQTRFESRFPAARRSSGTEPESSDETERLSERGALVQQFAPEVADGELSLVFFEGEYSHAWRSLRAPDALGLDADFERTTERYDPSPAVLDHAAEVLDAAAEILDTDRTRLPYARVDCVYRRGEFRLMELELIEPYLNLGRSENAVEMLAEAVETELHREIRAE